MLCDLRGPAPSSEGVEALSSAVLASCSDAQFTKEQPFRRRSMHGALNDFDQAAFIAPPRRHAFGLWDNRTHVAGHLKSWEEATLVLIWMGSIRRACTWITPSYF